MLAEVQTPGGAIPGPSAGRRADESATPVEFFRKAYQATLVTALAALIVSHRRSDGSSESGPAAQERPLAIRGTR
jgi:hypothetical protein